MPSNLPNKNDAIDLLVADHEAADKLFKKYQKLRTADAPAVERAALAEKICLDVKVHLQIEEDIFYPALKGKIEDAMLAEAYVEHNGAKDLVKQITGMDADDELFDAKVTVLGEYIRHHVEEEHSEMFPTVRKTDLDLKALRAKLQARKEKLLEDYAYLLKTEPAAA